YDRIPARGPDAALTVAGTVSGWTLALEAAASLGGRMPRGDLIADAIRRAREGSPVSRSEASALRDNLAEFSAFRPFAAQFLPGGKVPEVGANRTQPKLAATLEQLAHAGFDDFYRGDVAAEIAADLEEAGTPVTRADLEKHEARLVVPLSLALPGVDLFNTPPPTQGLASLIILGLFERLKVARGESFEHLHGLIESAKRAYRVRDRHVTDPAFGGGVRQFLEAAWLD